MATQKLYYLDAHQQTFTAAVLSCLFPASA